MDHKLAKRDYDGQRLNAKARRITWHFTFEEWVQWWVDQLGPNWQEKRGRLRHQYVMARDDDIGSYVWWNVKCITASQNQLERPSNGTSLKGTKHPMVLLNERKVKAIYHGRDNFAALGRKYGVHRDTVIAIKKRRLWSHLSEDWGPAYFNPKRQRPTGKHYNSANRKLTAQKVKQIFYAAGSSRSIGLKYGVSGVTVDKIKQKTTWKHVTSTL